jgi:SAM-dependent methyltransferase
VVETLMPVKNPDPFALVRLSFNSLDEYSDYWSRYPDFLREAWLSHESIGNRSERFENRGWCDLCLKACSFSATPDKQKDGAQFPFRINWWQGFNCDCKLNTLERSVLRVLKDEAKESSKLYHVGFHSRFRKQLSERFEFVSATQYEEGRSSGHVDENGIRYEDLTQLSFDSDQFDFIICMEVLEHIPFYEAAMREMRRTLRPGGRAVLSFPWLGGKNYAHLVRAELLPNGEIRHLLPPEYHGDPASEGGILSFRAFGWRILDELRQAGFTSAKAEYIFGPFHGYMQLINPIIVATK